MTDIPRPPAPALGRHLIAEFHGASRLLHMDGVEDVLREAAEAVGATVLRVEGHDFGERAGFTALALLAESHLSVHTWPEHGYAAIDLFVCGELDPAPAVEVLAAWFRPEERHLRVLPRGRVGTAVR